MTRRMFALWTVALIAATWAGGWWGAVLIPAGAGLYHRADGGRPWSMALCAMLAWALLLGFDAARGPFGDVANTVSAAMELSVPLIIVATLLLSALLAWSSAVVAAELAQRLRHQ